MSIAILCPTRKRSEQCQRMVSSAYRNSVGNVLIYIAVSDDESQEYQDALFVPDQNRVGVCMVAQPDGMPTAHKWNRLAELASGQPVSHFMLGSDDIIFDTPGWDKSLLDHYNASENKIHVYSLRDSRDPEGTPHPIVTREYIEAMGYFLPPIFLHWFVDSWTVAIAKANGVFTHMKDYLLVHDKPSDRGQPDETHSRIRQWGWHERDKYVNDTCQHFFELEKAKLSAALNLPIYTCDSNVNALIAATWRQKISCGQWSYPEGFEKCTVEVMGGGT